MANVSAPSSNAVAPLCTSMAHATISSSIDLAGDKDATVKEFLDASIVVSHSSIEASDDISKAIHSFKLSSDDISNAILAFKLSREDRAKMSEAEGDHVQALKFRASIIAPSESEMANVIFHTRQRRYNELQSRVRITARKSTGGKTPRKQLASGGLAWEINYNLGVRGRIAARKSSGGKTPCKQIVTKKSRH